MLSNEPSISDYDKGNSLTKVRVYEFCRLYSVLPRVHNVLLVLLMMLLLIVTYQFLNQAYAGQRPEHTWFLEITFVWEVGMHVCVCVCVCVCPQAIKNYSHEMSLNNQSNKSYFFSFYIRHLLSILLKGVALVTKHVVSYCQIRAR